MHLVVDVLYRGADTERPGHPCDRLLSYDGFTNAKVLETFPTWISVVYRIISDVGVNIATRRALAVS